MSRIDEALRRSERADHSHSGPVTIERPAADGLKLDVYSAEPLALPDVPEERRPPATILEERRSAATVTTSHRPGAAIISSGPRPIAPSAISETAGAREKLATIRAMDPIALEQYRRLAATLEEAQAARGLKRLMVTSAIPREGKTLTTVNLAVTLADSYKRRVLVIDADFRRPNVHEGFGIPNGAGLAALLRKPEAVCRPIEVSGNLHVLTAGALDSSPTAALSSDRMLQIVSAAAAEFDWVLLDTPPVTLLTDAQLVARITDGVLLVVAATMTPYSLVQRTIEELGADRIVGSVLNRAAQAVLPANEYYGRYYSAAERE